MNASPSQPPTARCWNRAIRHPPERVVLVDCRGMSDIHAVFAVARAARAVSEGGHFEVLADNAGLTRKLNRWCNIAGAELEEVESSQGTYRAYIYPPYRQRRRTGYGF